MADKRRYQFHTLIMCSVGCAGSYVWLLRREWELALGGMRAA